MSKFKYILITAISLVFTSTAYAQQTGTYDIDPMHSKVGFEIPHLVISTVDGKFTEFSGTIDLNAKDFNKSKVKASINVNSIDTGVKKRDDHLRSQDFFEVAKYPSMKFISQKISGDQKKFKMTGDLTIKGTTKKVTFDGKYLGTVKDGYGNLKTAFKAETKVDRKDFGLKWNSMVEAGPVVGDEVKISLTIQAAKPQPKKQAKAN